LTRNTAREVDFFKESGKIGAILLRPGTVVHISPRGRRRLRRPEPERLSRRAFCGWRKIFSARVYLLLNVGPLHPPGAAPWTHPPGGGGRKTKWPQIPCSLRKISAKEPV